MRCIRLIALGIALVAAIAGCTSPAEAPLAAPSTRAPTLTPTAQPRETGLTRPALVFGGQCDELFGDADLASVMGAPLTRVDNHWDDFWGGDERFAQYGGFECTWTSEQARVIALVLPEAAVSYAPRDYECAQTHDSFAMSCPLEAISNGIRLSGLATLGLDPATAAVARDGLLAIFNEKAGQHDPVPVPLAAAGSWPLSVDCSAISSGADFAGVPGLGAGTVDIGAMGAGKDVSQAEAALVPGEYFCAVQGESAMMSYTYVGGARWSEALVAQRSDATPLSLEGVDAAYGVPYGEAMTLVHAFSGPNLLLFQVRHVVNAQSIAVALIASLDATAVN